jgi:hypothetical protein
MNVKLKNIIDVLKSIFIFLGSLFAAYFLWERVKPEPAIEEKAEEAKEVKRDEIKNTRSCDIANKYLSNESNAAVKQAKENAINRLTKN